MHINHILLLIASIVCTADCDTRPDPNAKPVYYERSKANGLVRYRSTNERSASMVRKQRIIYERNMHNYVFNTKHKEQDKCIVAITDSPAGGLTAVSELCHLFGIRADASPEFKTFYTEQVSLIENDATRVLTANTIRLNEPGSAISSVFRVMLAHSMLNYEHYQPIKLSGEYIKKYAKYPNLILALITEPGTRPQMPYTRDTAMIAARILENGFAYGNHSTMPDGKAPIVTGISDLKAKELREMAMDDDADTIYDEMGALDTLLRVYGNDDVRRLVANDVDAKLRANEDILRLLNEDQRGRGLVAKIQSHDDISGTELNALLDHIRSKALTMFADSKDNLGDRMWRYMYHIGSYEGLLSITVNVVLNHHLPLSLFENEGNVYKYIKNIDREFPIITADIESGIASAAAAERRLLNLKLEESRPARERIRDELQEFFLNRH